jgi:disulfide bond formation protein DsbB
MHRILIAVAVVFAAVALAACGSSTPAAPFGDSAAGREVFLTTCVPCHGQGATGVPGLGKDLTTSTWTAEQTDQQLLAFLLTGRPASDPLNTTGVDMPPKGGNPALTEADLRNVVAYLRSIHK